MTIIIPIYNLRGSRFNNFCFLIKQLKNVESEIIVCEQHSNQSVNVNRFLSRFKRVKYICNNTNFDYFNKSHLINLALKEVTTEFTWMVDADFFTDYQYVIEQVNTKYNYSDFIRPFSEIILLDKNETETLFSLNKVVLCNEEYQSNSQDGKYSFIVRTDVFKSCGGLNEDFKGWGFQDLDFVYNRLPTDARKDYINKQAFHLHHEKAKKEHVVYNRTLYENLGGLYNKTDKRISVSTINEQPQIKTKIIEYRERNKKNNQDTYIDQHEESSTQQPYKQRDVWSSPTTGVVCVKYIEEIKLLNSRIKKSIVKDEPKLIYTNKGMQKTIIKKSPVVYYVKHIIKVYDTLLPNQTLLFANNLFSNKKSDIDLLTQKITDISKQSFEQQSADFQWLFPKKTKFINNKQKTTCGCFLVSSNLVLKNPIEFYIHTHRNLLSMSFDEQTDKLENVYKIFN